MHPSDMKGLVKSATASRSELMVRGAMATSASCEVKFMKGILIKRLPDS